MNNSKKEFQGNDANVVLSEVFEKKYIIGGLFVFGYITDVYSIDFEKMAYSQKELDSFIEETANLGLDYIVLPTYTARLNPKKYRVVGKIERIKQMCKNIGWGCCG